VRKFRRFCCLALAAGAPVFLYGCAAPVAENAALIDKSLQPKSSRLKIYREENVGLSSGARVKLDGRQIASLDSGGSTVLDIPAGPHELTVDNPMHPNVYTMKLDAKPGMIHRLEVSIRAESVVASAFGGATWLIEAAANENGGTYQIRLIDTKPAPR
jgi:hypothetical protein